MKVWGYPWLLVSPCKMVSSMVEHSLGGMVRVVDFWEMSYKLADFNFHKNWRIEAISLEHDESEAVFRPEIPFYVLLDKMGVGLRTLHWPPRDLDPEKYLDYIRQLYNERDIDVEEDLKHVEADPGHEKTFNPDGKLEDNDEELDEEKDLEDDDSPDKKTVALKHLTIAMGLAALLNLLKLRLPIDSGCLRLLKVSTNSNRFPVLLNAGDLDCPVEVHEDHFPSLSRLQDLELVASRVHDRFGFLPEKRRLFADQISWIVQKSPNLRTLRLGGFQGLGGRIKNFSLPCKNITTLCLIGCDIPIDDICLFLLCFPRLTTFKMTRTNGCGRSRWDSDNWDYSSAPWGASLVMEALSNAASQIQKVFLGLCVRANPPRHRRLGEPEEERPMLPTSGLRHLKTLGLTAKNLKVKQHDGGDYNINADGNTNADENANVDGNRNDVLANQVKDCPTLERLQIFGAMIEKPILADFKYHEFKWYPELKGWLEALAQELTFNKASQLREIKLWYVDREHHLRRLDDYEYLVNNGKLHVPSYEPGYYWHETMGNRRRATIHNKPPPILELEESGLVELYQSLGVKIILEKEQGYRSPGPEYKCEDCLLRPIGDMNSDEALWEGAYPPWTEDKSAYGRESLIP